MILHLLPFVSRIILRIDIWSHKASRALAAMSLMLDWLLHLILFCPHFNRLNFLVLTLFLDCLLMHLLLLVLFGYLRLNKIHLRTEVGGLLEVGRVHVAALGVLLFLIKDILLGVSLIVLFRFTSRRTNGCIILVSILTSSANHWWQSIRMEDSLTTSIRRRRQSHGIEMYFLVELLLFASMNLRRHRFINKLLIIVASGNAQLILLNMITFRYVRNLGRVIRSKTARLMHGLRLFLMLLLLSWILPLA